MPNPKKIKFRFSLPAKLVTFKSLFVIISGITVTISNVTRQREITEEKLLDKAATVSSLLKAGATNPLSNLDIGQLRLLLADIKRQKDVLYAYVFDENGYMLTDGTNTNRFRDQIIDGPVSKNAIAATGQIIQYDNNVLDIAEPVTLGPEKIGGVRVGFSLDALQQESDAILYRNIILSIILGLAGIFMVFLIANIIISPIHILITGAHRIGSGDYKHCIDIDTHDEIGDLARAFNTMAQNLNQSNASEDPSPPR
ncbi:MAG: HAMP domain-containing protein [Sedimentisphaerales bacterium]|nr:HAMP domain-containing protein [Sedimentisphaerales bacterium]